MWGRISKFHFFLSFLRRKYGIRILKRFQFLDLSCKNFCYVDDIYIYSYFKVILGYTKGQGHSENRSSRCSIYNRASPVLFSG